MARSLASFVLMAFAVSGAYTAPGFLVPDQSSRVDDYIVSIERKFTNDFEASLIKQAESTYGDVADREHPEKSPDRRSKRWWCDEFDNVRILCAVTEDSVRYYLDLVNSFRKGDFTSVKGFQYGRASLRYRASVDFHPTFELKERQFINVYVVSMELNWSVTCGFLCGHYPVKKRIVVFDSKGQLLLLEGDGWESFVVSELAPAIRPNPPLNPTGAKGAPAG